MVIPIAIFWPHPFQHNKNIRLILGRPLDSKMDTNSVLNAIPNLRCAPRMRVIRDRYSRTAVLLEKAGRTVLFGPFQLLIIRRTVSGEMSASQVAR